MDFFSQNKIVSYANPIDCIEDHIYKFDVEPLRYSADHLGLKFNGSWSKYEIAIVWNETNKIINFSACYDFKKKTKITKEIYSLISSINEKINLGYFHYCSQHRTIFFKYQVSTKGFNYMTLEQIENFLSVVVKEFDRFFPIFLASSSRKNDEKLILRNSLLDTSGIA